MMRARLAGTVYSRESSRWVVALVLMAAGGVAARSAADGVPKGATSGGLLQAFSQPPTTDGEHIESNFDFTDEGPNVVLADDFLSDGRTVTAVRFWGGPIPPPVVPCSLENGGFETGDFTGWTAVDNGVQEDLRWSVDPTGTCHAPWSCTNPLEGGFDAWNGFDGDAGSVYEMYQDVFLSFGATVTLITHHRIQFDSSGAPSTLPREIEISVRDTSNEILEVLYHQEVSINGAPYTEIPWNEQVFDLSAHAGGTVRVHFNVFIPEALAGAGMIEFDDIAISCVGADPPERAVALNQRAMNTAANTCGPGSGDCCADNGSPGCQDTACCALVCNGDPFCCAVLWDDICGNKAAEQCEVCLIPGAPIIDGWVVGFHAMTAGTVGQTLGVYFCGAEGVSKTSNPLSACDGLDVTEYQVSLEDCCLVSGGMDDRDGSIPAGSDGFHPSPCTQYAVSISALVGRRYDAQAGQASLVGQWDVYPGEYGDVCADGGGWAFVSNVTRTDGVPPRIFVFDVEGAGQPQLETTYFIPPPNDQASPEDIESADGLLYVALAADGEDGVAVIDVRNPSAPGLVVTIRVPGFEDVGSLSLDGGYLYLAGETAAQVAVVDVGGLDPDSPPPSPMTTAKWMIDVVGVEGVCQVVARDGRLYVSACGQGLRVFDVGEVQGSPPTLLASMTARRADASWPNLDHTFVVTAEHQSGGGLSVYQLQEIDSALVFVHRDFVSLGQEGYSAIRPVMEGNRIYATWAQAGLRIFDLDPSTGRLNPVGQYDTNPSEDTGEPFGGRGVDVSLGGDRILVTDSSAGFFVIDGASTEMVCVGSETGRSSDDPFWSWLSTGAGAGLYAAGVGVAAVGIGDTWSFDAWQAMAPNCTFAEMALELLTAEPDPGITCGCTVDDACDDDDACTFDRCVAGACTHAARRYGDVDANGIVNIFDLFCVLDGFAGDFAVCSFTNIDVNPCMGNGFINIFDLFAVLGAFQGDDPCACPPP